LGGGGGGGLVPVFVSFYRTQWHTRRGAGKVNGQAPSLKSVRAEGGAADPFKGNRNRACPTKNARGMSEKTLLGCPPVKGGEVGKGG